MNSRHPDWPPIRLPAATRLLTALLVALAIGYVARVAALTPPTGVTVNSLVPSLVFTPLTGLLARY